MFNVSIASTCGMNLSLLYRVTLELVINSKKHFCDVFLLHITEMKPQSMHSCYGEMLLNVIELVVETTSDVSNQVNTIYLLTLSSTNVPLSVFFGY